MKVNGYETPLRPGVFVMVWGEPEECPDDPGRRVVVVPLRNDNVLVVDTAVDNPNVVFGYIMWPMSDLEMLCDPIRVLSDIHNGDSSKRVTRAGMIAYGQAYACPACGQGRKCMEYDGDAAACDCGWEGTRAETEDPGW